MAVRVGDHRSRVGHRTPTGAGVERWGGRPRGAGDGTSLVFGTPFQKRRLHRVAVADLAAETFRLRTSAVMPMLDIAALDDP